MPAFVRISPADARAGALLLGLALFSVAPALQAQAIIEQPGNHPDYAVELDPHLVLQHGETPVWYDTGIGVGLRATIPFLDGPITTINNSMGISFGGDWAHFGDDNCDDYYYWRDSDRNYSWDHRCNGNAFVFPVALQWNFWLTDIISVFGEPGLAVGYYRWEGWCWYGDTWGDCDGDHTRVMVDIAAGARFLFGERIGMTVRLGYPSITLGATFLL
ncbi:MAG: hypothetical protein JW751_05755 [Polyangiaceae bacterium]|nr:hypothetical protein [Polyangiaceae bacterium]